MQFINHKDNTIYSGDRAHWRDVVVESERPSTSYVPVVVNGEHTGWTLDEEMHRRIETQAAIKEFHDKQAQGFMLFGHRWRYRNIDIQLMTAEIASWSMSSPSSYWRDADGQHVALTQSQLEQLATEMKNKYMYYDARRQVKINGLD